ncbi:MAG: hypothetical protein Q9M09_06585 [Mariprofundaceae bacterium]|nr:hypothetical protein [Mariprofundaceae bacterium]
MKRLTLFMLMLLWPLQAMAVDSYRFLHVTIDTPWFIFVFLFFLVFSPMILMVVLYWRFGVGSKEEDESSADKKS